MIIRTVSALLLLIPLAACGSAPAVQSAALPTWTPLAATWTPVPIEVPPTAAPKHTPKPEPPTDVPTATPVPATATSAPTATPDPTRATVRVTTSLYRAPRVSTAPRDAALCPGAVVQGIESQRVNNVVWYHVRVVTPASGCGGDSTGRDGWVFAVDLDTPNGMAVAELAPIIPTKVPTLVPTERPTDEPVYVAPVAPSGGGFVCRDGSVSHAAHRQGACSHHGGVAP